MNRSYIAEYVANRNKLVSYLQRVVPVLAERLNAGFNFKADGSLFKKDNDDLREILRENDPGLIFSYFDTHGGSAISITSKITTPSSDHSVEYIEMYVYLWIERGEGALVPDISDLNLVTVDELKQADQRLDEIQRQISALRTEEGRIKWLLNR